MLPEFEGVDGALRHAVRECVEGGARHCVGDARSPGGGDDTFELLDTGFTLANARARLLASPARTVRLAAYAARLFWNLSGSNRLADIAAYDRRATRFSDDGLTVPGSCEGARLRYGRVGIDQLANAVALLRDDPATRRASCVFYFPEDVNRASKDVPCALSITFSLRDGRLHTTAVMRSNNLIGVLPYDVFLYTMLGELVARLCGAEPGRYSHFMISAHVYARDLPVARALCAAGDAPCAPMPPMPPVGELADLVPLLEAEREIRAVPLTPAALGAAAERARERFAPYWSDLLLVLLAHRAREACDGCADDERAALAQAWERVVAGTAPAVRERLVRERALEPVA